MSRIHQVAGLDSDESRYDYTYSPDLADPTTLEDHVDMQNFSTAALPTVEHSVSRRVNISQSPYLHAFYLHHPLQLTIDTGAETNMIRVSLAKYIGTKVTKSSQSAMQADGRTPLSVVGETRLSLTRHGRPLTLEALVIGDLDVDILAGTPFTASNDIAVRTAKHEIIITGSDVASYGYALHQLSDIVFEVCWGTSQTMRPAWSRNRTRNCRISGRNFQFVSIWGVREGN